MKYTALTMLMATAMIIPFAGVRADTIRSDMNNSMMYNQGIARTQAYGNMDARVHYLDRKEVQAIQQSLDESGFYSAGVDGVWGPKTVKAVQDFQVSSGLEPTGTIDEDTLNQLGLQLSAADQVETMNEPIQWRDGSASNYAPAQTMNAEDRIDGAYNVRTYTHENDR